MNLAGASLKRKLYLAGLFAGIMIALAIYAGWNQIVSLFVQLAPYDAGVDEGIFTPSSENVAHMLRAGILLCILALAAFASVAVFWNKARRPGISARVLSYASALACTGCGFMFLRRFSYEGSWYPLAQIVTSPESMGIYGRRLLFVWPAQAVHSLVPSLSAHESFLPVQAVVLFLTMIAIVYWAECFVGRDLAYLGPVFGVLLISVAFQYFNAYDIGIVLFYTLGFLFLRQRKYLLFSLIVGLATLNHENSLLLVFVAAAVCIGYESRRTTALVVGGSFLSWLVVRLMIAVLMPENGGFDYRFLTNLWIVSHPIRALIEAGFVFSLWLVLFAAGFQYADRFLRRSALLLIPLIGVTYLFGKFHEIRQFDAFIPVVIGVALSHLRNVSRRDLASKTQNTASEVRAEQAIAS